MNPPTARDVVIAVMFYSWVAISWLLFEALRSKK